MMKHPFDQMTFDQITIQSNVQSVKMSVSQMVQSVKWSSRSNDPFGKNVQFGNMALDDLIR